LFYFYGDAIFTSEGLHPMTRLLYTFHDWFFGFPTFLAQVPLMRLQ
jgi:hypothetical protein